MTGERLGADAALSVYPSVSQPKPQQLRALRRTLKQSYFETLAMAKVDRMLRWLNGRKGVALVLNLHRISPQRNPYWPPMTPEAFATLASYLAKSFDVRSFSDLALPAESRSARVVLSFDDGCRDFVEYAMPILDRHKLRANQNIIVKSVELQRPPWMIRLVDALNHAPTKRVQRLWIPGFNVRLDGDDDLSKERYGTLLTGYLKPLPRDEREAVFHDLAELLDETPPDACTPMMSRADVEAVAGVHEVGGHSYSHESVDLLSDGEFREDLDHCSAFFDRLGRKMSIYAFPYGRFRSGQIELVQSKGVEHVLLVGERPARIEGGVHTRITMYGTSPAELRLRAVGHRVSRR